MFATLQGNKKLNKAKMTKNQFIRKYARSFNKTVESVLKYYKPMVCNCEDKKGQHFAMILKDKYSIKTHITFNRYKHKRRRSFNE